MTHGELRRVFWVECYWCPEGQIFDRARNKGEATLAADMAGWLQFSRGEWLCPWCADKRLPRSRAK